MEKDLLERKSRARTRGIYSEMNNIALIEKRLLINAPFKSIIISPRGWDLSLAICLVVAAACLVSENTVVKLLIYELFSFSYLQRKGRLLAEVEGGWRRCSTAAPAEQGGKVSWLIPEVVWPTPLVCP